MKCKVTGLDCPENNHGWCAYYKTQQVLIEGCDYYEKSTVDELPKELQKDENLTIIRNGLIINPSIFRKALETYGTNNQIDMLIEEMAELTQALCKYKRGKAHNVEEELADVFIMLEQIKLLFDKYSLDKWLSFKVQRLEIQIENDK